MRTLHRGVYLLAPIVPPHAREMGAVLACMPSAVLSHASAAILWLLLPPPRKPLVPHVTVFGRNPNGKRGIHIHRVEKLDSRELRTRARIPLTSPARTLLDIASTEPARLEQAAAEAQARGLVTPGELSSLLVRSAGKPGVAALRQLIDGPGPRFTRSEAERRFLGLVGRARLPEPEVNGWLAGYEVDFSWRAHGLVVEVDGFAFHSSRASFEADRRRDLDLEARGFRVMRVTWRQIVEEPEVVLARVSQVLALALRPASPRGRGAAP